VKGVTVTEVRGFCTLCRSRCGAIYTIENGAMVSVRPDPDHPTGAALCAKGRAAPELVHSPARLTQPLRRTNPRSDPDPGWTPISWEEAMSEIAERLAEFRDTSGPESVAFAIASPSASPVSDSIEWIERFIHLFGSPNIAYNIEHCNWHKDFASAFTFGGTQASPDFAGAELSVLWGHNPAKTWLAQSAALAEAKTKGARLAVIDPRGTSSALQADHWLQVKPSTDLELALGLANLVLTRHGGNAEFLRSWSNGPLLVRDDDGRFLRAGDVTALGDGFVAWDETSGRPVTYNTTRAAVGADRFALRGTFAVHTRRGVVTCRPAFDHYAQSVAQWTPERTAAVTGVDVARLIALADDLATATSVSYMSWTGVGQNTQATQTERAIATLYALTGHRDAPGGNTDLPVIPLRPVATPLAPEQAVKALGLDEFPLGPPKSGWVTARSLCTAITDGDPYKVRALFTFGANVLLSQPDSRRMAQALRQLEFAVHVDLFMNPTAELADIVLPAGAAWEREAMRAGFDVSLAGQQRLQLRPRMVEPRGESRSDLEIVFDLATRLGLGGEFFGGDIDRAYNYRLEPLGLTVDDLRARPGGIDVPLRLRHRKYAEEDSEGRVTGFNTPTRRVELYSQLLLDHGYPPVPVTSSSARASDSRFPLTLTCAKNGYYAHSQQRNLSSLRKRSPEPFADVSESLARARAIADGDLVEIVTAQGTVRMRARVDPLLHDEVVYAEYGWWQSAPDLALPGSDPLADGGLNYNVLVDDTHHDPVSGAAPLRSVACDVRAVPTSSWAGQREFVVAAAPAATPEIRRLVLRPADENPLPDFLPGQHVTLAEPGRPETTRAYSLTGRGRAEGREVYEVAIRRVEGGEFSPAVHDRFEVGTPVLVTAPSGLFAIPVDHTQPVVLMAAGVGITPFLSYLETLATSSGSVPEVVLHYGSRSRRAHAFERQLQGLEGRIPNLRVVNHYSRPGEEDVAGVHYSIRGRVSAVDVDEDLIRRRARFYLCGPEEMLESVISGLTARGVPRFDIFAEKFHATPRVVDVPDGATAVVRFARSNREVRWAKGDGTLLDLGQRHGISMPSGCRLGQCESCAVSVLSGEVAHMIAPADDLPDDQCLTCQAMPMNDVVLDV
jgi:anaerobic selenocysteine-containing dehydrogenase/ferredoxin-NADP reductase